MSIRIEEVHFTPGRPRDRDAGLIGYLRLVYGALVLDGIVVRRTASGRITLSWPARRDRSGREHALLRPLDDAARTDMEREILAQVGLAEVEP